MFTPTIAFMAGGGEEIVGFGEVSMRRKFCELPSLPVSDEGADDEKGGGYHQLSPALGDHEGDRQRLGDGRVGEYRLAGARAVGVDSVAAARGMEAGGLAVDVGDAGDLAAPLTVEVDAADAGHGERLGPARRQQQP